MGLQLERWREVSGWCPPTTPVELRAGSCCARWRARCSAVHRMRFLSATPRRLRRSPTVFTRWRSSPVSVTRDPDPAGVDAYAERLTALGQPPAVFRPGAGHGSQVSGTLENFLLISGRICRSGHGDAPLPRRPRQRRATAGSE
ncbi:hypothetical protein HBB16_04330 [Pseudonocardia sp. MCCB 268]|nr:hypothetical protein [Pseudonocardia cytotoxica]